VLVVAALLLAWAGPAASAWASNGSSSEAPTVSAAPARVSPKASAGVANGGRVTVIVSLAHQGTALTGAPAASRAGRAATTQASAALQRELPRGSATRTRVLSHLGLVVTTVDARGLAALAASPEVASVAVSQAHHLELGPEDTAIDAPAAWTAGTGYNGAGQTVAIIDTGVQVDHPFLGGRVIDGGCFESAGPLGGGATVTSDCPGGSTSGVTGSPSDGAPCGPVIDSDGFNECAHGTHVAGIAAGGSGSTSGNGSGVAWGADILSGKVFSTVTDDLSDCGSLKCVLAFDGDIMAGLDWVAGLSAVDHVASVNLSLGFGTSPGACDGTVDDPYGPTFATLRADGVAPVVAAGNSGSSPSGLSFPACDSRAVSVGAVNDTGTFTSFTQDSPNLSMLAPGSNVLSSVPGSTFQTLSGTSMATPFVTGTFAVVKQEHPDWGVADIESLLRGTGLPIADNRPGALGEATPNLDLGGAVVPPTFHAVVPGRLLDTRNSAGLPNSASRLGDHTTINIGVTGHDGVPSAGVSAVVLNVTAVDPVGNGFVTVWPSGFTQPATSNLNVTPGVTKPNLVTVKVGAGGQVSIFNFIGSTDLVVDIDGWYDAGGSQATGGTLHAVTPQRVLDTRNGTGLPGNVAHQMAAGAIVKLPVVALAGLPSTAKAVVLNLTSVHPSQQTFVTAWPDGTGLPLASSLNPEAGLTNANLVVVPIGADGDVDLINALGTLDLVADLDGWFDAVPTPTSGHLVPLSPARLLDTRDGTGLTGGAHQMGPDTSIDLQVTGRGGVPVSGVSAVVINVTAVTPTTETFITAWPNGSPQPLASSLNPLAGRITPNLVVIKVGTGGQIQLFNAFGNVDLVADVFGWYSA
jgi:subtilisin family serine protease